MECAGASPTSVVRYQDNKVNSAFADSLCQFRAQYSDKIIFMPCLFRNLLKGSVQRLWVHCASVAQSVERVLGKDKVEGSNPS
jgi:hypothetical protein